MNKKVLIIEDEELMRVTLGDFLSRKGYSVEVAETGRQGLELFHTLRPHLVVTDVRLPDINGLEILKQLKDTDPEVVVIVITAYGTIKDAVEAMKTGAYDYITKPFSLDEFELIIKRAFEVIELRQENILLKEQVVECICYPEMVAQSDEMRKVCRLIAKVARTDTTVLLLGESGTGKELVASTIHRESHRRDGPFVVVNCAALPETLIESELFGHEKGAFTGAHKPKPGKFELARGGSIFLDEIGELPPQAQAKLLRVLQDGTFERLGSTTTLRTDARVIAATNRDLEKETKEGRFREDLYWRLNVVPIHIPPLRQRKEDILPLAEFFLQRFNKRHGRSITLSRSVKKALLEYDFPGNVRELENLMERLVTLAEGPEIRLSDLPEEIRRSTTEAIPEATLQSVTERAERQHILRVLKATGGNRTKAAKVLGISRKSLWEKMRQYGITDQA